MPRPKGIRPDPNRINALIEQQKRQRRSLKDIVSPSLQKAFYRARKGMAISEGSLNLIAQALNVDSREILPDDIAEDPEVRTFSLRCAQIQNLKDVERTWFSAPDFNDTDIIVPTEIDARFLVDDPNQEQTELAAEITEAIEKLLLPIRPSEMIRTKGRLNSAIKQCQDLNMGLYGSSYRKRMGAWPYWDADQVEKASAATALCLLVVFGQGPATRSIQQQVDLGSSTADIQEETQWLDDLIHRAKTNHADDDEIRHLEKLRKQARDIFVDHRI